MITIALPFPPSVNRIWRSRTGANGKPSFYLDTRYATWKRVCDSEFMALRPKPKVAGNFGLVLILNEKKRKSNTDADNRMKAVLDWLQRVKVVENDALADAVEVRWGYAPEGCRIEISTAPSPL